MSLSALHIRILTFCLFYLVEANFSKFQVLPQIGLWLGHSNTCCFLLLNQSSVVLVIYLEFLSSWKVNLHNRSFFLQSENGFLLGLPCIWVYPSCSQQFPSLCWWKAPSQHDVTTTVLHCREDSHGDEQWCFSPKCSALYQDPKFCFGPITPENSSSI